MGKSWENHGKTMGKPWENHSFNGSNGEKPSENHGKMVISWGVDDFNGWIGKSRGKTMLLTIEYGGFLQIFP